MSLKTTNVYFPIDVFNNEQDIDVIKYKLQKFTHKLQSTLKEEDFSYIINFSIKILYEYFDKDSSLFFTIKQLREYIKISMISAFWISYKFLADEGEYLFANEIADILKIKTKVFLDKEREILLFINYQLFKFLKSFDDEIIICNEENL